MNASDILWENASRFANKPLLYAENRAVTFSFVADGTCRLATALRSRGIAKGDRVLIAMNNCAEWLISLFAVLRVGAIAVPINPGLRPREMCVIAEHCEPRLAIVDFELSANFASLTDQFPKLVRSPSGVNEWHELVASAEPDGQSAQTEPDAIGMIFYTSGTTGAPKGVMISHAAAIYIAQMTASHMQIGPEDVSLVMGSLAFIYPLAINCLASIWGGASVVLQHHFHPKLVSDAIRDHKVTVMMGVPTMYVMLMNFSETENRDFSSIRLAISGGASLPDALCRRAKEKLGFEIFDLWGMTECTPVTSYDPRRDTRGFPDSCGRALPGCSFKIVDEDLRTLPTGSIGEVMLTGPVVMSGYYKNPAVTAETLVDGWIRSGDLGSVDSDGHLFIVGRKKDLIIRGGANVYPVEIEEVLYGHPEVAECAVVGVPDEIFGERVKAFIVKRSAKVTTEQVRDFCKERIADYKVPSEIEFVSELPKGPTGKILRRELRSMRSAVPT